MIPLPRVPVSQQSYGQFAAPTAAPMQDAGPQQMQQLGASLLNAGASAARIGADLQADLDQGFLMESDALASELARNTVGSYRQMAGLPAIESFGDTQEQLRTKLRNLSDTARSPEQKQRLERILVQRMQDASESMAAHRDVQVRNRAIGGAKAGMESEIQNYLAALGNPDDMKLARDLMIERAGELSRHRGEDGDMAKLTLLDATTRMHAGAVDALLAADRPTEALAYLEQHKGEIAAPERAQTTQKARAGFVEWGARQLDQNVPDINQRLAVVADWQKAGRITGDEAESARRHVMQFERVRLEQGALQERALRQEAAKWLAANPALAITDNPDLANRFRALNAPFPERVYTTDPKFVEQLQAMPAAVAQQFQQMSDAMLEKQLRPFLDDHDLKKWTAFFRGDQDIVGRQDRIKRAAEVLGVVSDPVVVAGMTKEERAANAQKLARFEAQVQRQVDTLRAEKKGDLTTREIQEQILDPMMAEGNKVTNASGTQQSVVAAQIAGDLPYDDPTTPNVDESLDLSKFPKAADYSVPVDGKPVFLRDVPMVVRKAIRDSWAKDNPGKQMTVAQEIEEYARVYRPKMEAAKQAEQSANVWRQMWGLPPGASTVTPEQFKQAMKDR
ncbi:MAG: hypothetical protein RJA36_1116 [Pseudomonadota bacterium]|jgi:hypothetical protein